VQRPLDQSRLNEMCQPRLKAEDPSLKPPEKKKKAAKLTQRQIEQRAERVRQRQQQRFN
jgi:hypothetical protein